MKYFILLAIFLLPLTTLAQLSSFEETVLIELSSEYPSPRKIISARAISSNYEDLSRHNIIWALDGVEKKRGLGEKTFQFQAPANGKSAVVSVTVEKESGFTYQGSNTIRPGNLDLIYEADTYTPPFYKGRSLFTHQSTITVAAMTDFISGGIKIPKNRILYTWKKDGRVLSDQSGVGKDSLIIQGQLVQGLLSISVKAESLDYGITAEKKILINQTTPNVVLYENNPIYGSIFEKALTGTFNFDREEVGFTAIPYFFTAKDRSDSNLKYSWYENNQRIGDETFGSFINYLNPNMEKSGLSNIRVEVEQNNKLLQIGSTDFEVNVLGQQQSGTIRTNETSAF